jgi:NAD(P)-dependent dehydrogenase (short-subunit alcohol dehydrogenase family)
MSLDNRKTTPENAKVIVTGGASGMGAGIVRALAIDGWNVVSCDVVDDRGREIAEGAAVGAAGSVSYVHCDVSDRSSVEDAFTRAGELLGGLDVLVHAAGIAPASPADRIDVGEWDRVMEINARGTYLTNIAAQRMLAGTGGRIINFASGAGANGYPGKAHYAASKGAVLAWTRTVAQEWGPMGITVNALAPAIATPMYADTRAAMTPEQLSAHDAEMSRRMPIDGHLGDIDRDLVPVVRFLAGPGARFITGQLIAVDGGMLMVR